MSTTVNPVNPESPVKFHTVAQELLRFDPTNPRFPKSVKTLDQAQIQELLEKEPHFALELIPSFLENGFIDYEPLVVRAEGDHYVVVEGNRRLAALRHILARREQFASKSTQLDDLKDIPVLVFPDVSSEQGQKERRVYLGVRHLFGFREWPPESKARYLDSQIKSADDLARLMRELNISRQDIQRYLVPYRLRKKAEEQWHRHDDQDFWVLGEGLNRSGIKSYIRLELDRASMRIKSYEPKKLSHLLTFIYGRPSARDSRIVKETRELSTLSSLLKDKRAAAALEKGKSLDEAGVLVESLDESLSRLRELVRGCRSVVVRFKHRSSAADMVRKFSAFEAAAKEFSKNDGR